MEPVSFDRLYHEQKEKVWALTSRYAGSHLDREDLFQDVFIAIHRALPKYRGEASVSTWVYRITANISINYLNRKKRYEKLKEIWGRLGVGEHAAPNEPEDDGLCKLLDKLNPRQRTIMLLADVEEKSLQEISQWLNIPEGTVKSNLHRAREIIRKELEKNG